MSGDREKWEARGVVYDDQVVSDNEAPAAAPPPEARRRRNQFLREAGGPDQFDAQWARGERGWLSLRDPVTHERVLVPTKYAEAPLPPGTEAAPQWLVRRAMEKLPPKPPPPPAPRPRPARPLPPVPDDGGPL